ncbi:MAG: Fe-S cluster assembly protein SufD [Acidobacteria bacterium]|nr:MAG: Fe-S cluster assembly protein SufD [Acidobacteriota bacterium]
MIQAVRKEKDQYLANFAEFERQGTGPVPDWLQQLRKASILRVAEYGFPTTRDEDWKYTNLAPLSRTAFGLAGPTRLYDQLSDHWLLGLPGPRLVFVNGFLSSDLSRRDGLPDSVQVQSLSEALTHAPDLVGRHVGKYADPDEHAFTALNTAFMKEGSLVVVPPGTVLETPIHLIYLSTGSEHPFAVHPRNLLLIGANSEVRIVEGYAGQAGVAYFCNPVTELVAGDASNVDHYTIQAEGDKGFHIGTLRTCQERSSSLRLASFDVGGSLVRHNLTVTLDGEGANALLHGLYLGASDQLIDNHTRIEHVKAHCDSRELYKGILTDSSRAVFHGRIVVSKGAQKTDSKQTNNNLLLSNDCLVNTKPQLEIYADDVKCTHGATIGRLEEESLFYLRSRGIDKQAAANLLTYAFASEIVSQVRIGDLRNQLDRFLFAWLGHVPE